MPIIVDSPRDPTPLDVASFLGREDDQSTLDLAATHLAGVTAMVKAYTRGRGFDPATGAPGADVAIVIVSSTARLVNNPELNRSESIAGYSVQPAAFLGWTLPELAILNGYRKRAA